MHPYFSQCNHPLINTNTITRGQPSSCFTTILLPTPCATGILLYPPIPPARATSELALPSTLDGPNRLLGRGEDTRCRCDSDFFPKHSSFCTVVWHLQAILFIIIFTIAVITANRIVSKHLMQ